MSSVNNNCSCNLSWCKEPQEKAKKKSSLKNISETLTVPQKPQALERSVTPIQSREEIEQIFNIKIGND